MVKTDILSHFNLTNYTWVPAALLSILNIILSEFMVNFSLKKNSNVAINNHKRIIFLTVVLFLLVILI